MKKMVVGSDAGRRDESRVVPPPQALLERLKDYDQEGTFDLWEELNADKRDLVVEEESEGHLKGEDGSCASLRWAENSEGPMIFEVENEAREGRGFPVTMVGPDLNDSHPLTEVINWTNEFEANQERPLWLL